MQKTPYSYKFFQVEPEVQKIDSFKEWATEIDDYVLSEIESNHLVDSLETYEHILSQLISGLPLNPDTIGSKKMEKIHRWIKEVVRPQRELEMKRKQIMGI